MLVFHHNWKRESNSDVGRLRSRPVWECCCHLPPADLLWEVRARESHLTEPPRFTVLNQKLLHQSQGRRPTDHPGSTLVMLESFSSMKCVSLSLRYFFSVHEQPLIQVSSTGPIVLKEMNT